MFLQTAFKIRRFSRKQLEQIKKSSITSLKKVWIPPVQSWDPVPLLTLFAITGTNLLSQKMVCTLKPPVIITTLLFATSTHRADFSCIGCGKYLRTPQILAVYIAPLSRKIFDSKKKK